MTAEQIDAIIGCVETRRDMESDAGYRRYLTEVLTWLEYRRAKVFGLPGDRRDGIVEEAGVIADERAPAPPRRYDWV